MLEDSKTTFETIVITKIACKVFSNDDRVENVPMTMIRIDGMSKRSKRVL